MKSDFIEAKEQLEQIGIIRISEDFYMHPKKRGATYFVKSPVSKDKNWSLALNPLKNRYTDFANGNENGDIISFVAYVRGCNNWESLQLLKKFYGLGGREDRTYSNIRQEIDRRRREEQERLNRKKDFQTALFSHIDTLKNQAHNLQVMTKQAHCEAFADSWCYAMNELQIIEDKLDVLCAVPNKRYYKMKLSDLSTWLLDCLKILKSDGVFEGAQEEVKEIAEMYYR